MQKSREGKKGITFHVEPDLYYKLVIKAKEKYENFAVHCRSICVEDTKDVDLTDPENIKIIEEHDKKNKNNK